MGLQTWVGILEISLSDTALEAIYTSDEGTTHDLIDGSFFFWDWGLPWACFVSLLRRLLDK